MFIFAAAVAVAQLLFVHPAGGAPTVTVGIAE
jgi:hypothetical protein